jgi:hypothetical protein
MIQIFLCDATLGREIYQATGSGDGAEEGYGSLDGNGRCYIENIVVGIVGLCFDIIYCGDGFGNGYGDGNILTSWQGDP